MELTVYSILLCLCKNKNKSPLVLTIDKQSISKDNGNQTKSNYCYFHFASNYFTILL